MLRSINSLRGRTIHAAGGDCGSVDDLLIDDENWAIRYLVVDLQVEWIPGRKLPVSPASTEETFPEEEIKNAPEYDPRLMMSRACEDRRYEYYSRPRYWEPRL